MAKSAPKCYNSLHITFLSDLPIWGSPCVNNGNPHLEKSREILDISSESIIWERWCDDDSLVICVVFQNTNVNFITCCHWMAQLYKKSSWCYQEPRIVSACKYDWNEGKYWCHVNGFHKGIWQVNHKVGTLIRHWFIVLVFFHPYCLFGGRRAIVLPRHMDETCVADVDMYV